MDGAAGLHWDQASRCPAQQPVAELTSQQGSAEAPVVCAPTPASPLPPMHLQFKWAEPEETGGRLLEYVFEVGRTEPGLCRPLQALLLLKWELLAPASVALLAQPASKTSEARASFNCRCAACPQMAPAPEGWEGVGPTPEGFYPVYRGSERAFLAKRLVPGVQYCGRVKAINCEVGGRRGAACCCCCCCRCPAVRWPPQPGGCSCEAGLGAVADTCRRCPISETSSPCSVMGTFSAACLHSCRARVPGAHWASSTRR